MMTGAGCIDEKQILRSAKVILELAKKTSKLDLTQPLDEKPIVIQITFKKIPDVQNQVIKIHLPETVTHSNTEVCLFTKDLDKSSRDYEPTIRHYKDLLDAARVKQDITIIPYKCLVLEYQPYEAKRNLSNMYDIFLADDRITHRLPTLMGKSFLARKKYPIRVSLTSKNLKQEIEKALSTTQCVVTGRGSSCQVSVARTGMTAEQIANNVKAVIRKVTESLPGGCNNIRNIHIKTPDSPSLPLYISFGKRDRVKMPRRKVISQKTEPQEVTTVQNALVKITKSGDIVLVRKPVIKDKAALIEKSSASEIAEDKLGDVRCEESLQEDASLVDEVPSKRKRVVRDKQEGGKKHILTRGSDQRQSNEDSGSGKEPAKEVKHTKMAAKKKLQKSSIKQKQGRGELNKKRKLEGKLAEKKVSSKTKLKKAPKQLNKEQKAFVR